ncbi:MAG: SH3 domain-containing protein [Clostridia bacterium]|nr:SH3 domain-containing protein [Clostridia bacterium]
MKYTQRFVAILVTIALLGSLLVSSGMMTASALEGVGKSSTYVRLHGVDLSYWNTNKATNYSLVNFSQLASSGCDFVILRIGLGSSSGSCTMDKAFMTYYSRARAAGLKVGINFYSHATTYSHAAKEAKWVIDVIERNNMYFEYPIYTDMEEKTQTALSNSAFTNVALGFCETMEAAGYFPAMYGANSSMSKLSSSFCSRYDRWTAKVKANETPSNRFYWNTYDYSANFGMWQYTWRGEKIFSGIGLNFLDVNICYKDYPAIMAQYGYNNMQGGGSVADKLGTYYITAPVDDPLNVRDKATTSDSTILDTVKLGDIVNVTALSGNWGRFVSPNGSDGWASLKNYSDYIGIDAQAYTSNPAWGTVAKSVDENGRTTLSNTSDDAVAYDFKLPVKVGTSTTPYFAIQIAPSSGGGYYFGLTESGTGYYMMRDCNSGDQLVQEESAPYMNAAETLEIKLADWWKTNDYRIDTVRVYLAPHSDVTINYMYFAVNSNTIKDTTYNLNKGTVAAINQTLMDPDRLTIVDPTKHGGYTYQNGMLCVTSEEDSGYEVAFNLNKTFDLDDVTQLLLNVEAQVRYEISLTVTTADGDRTFGVCADFWPAICDAPDGDYIPAMTHTAGLDFKSCYTYNNVIPADGVTTVKTVTVKLGGKGKVYVNALQLANNHAIVIFYDGVQASETSPSDTPDPIRPTPVVTPGDVNGDDVVTTADARMILKQMIGMITFSDDQTQAADYNGDGEVTSADTRRMLLDMIA